MVETSRDWSEKLPFALWIPKAEWAQARLDQLNLLDERRLKAADHVIRGLIRDPRGKFKPNWSGPYFIRELTLEALHG
ncbi:hypothetical protein AAG906_022122 [Vitis piasezkii]